MVAQLLQVSMPETFSNTPMSREATLVHALIAIADNDEFKSLNFEQKSRSARFVADLFKDRDTAIRQQGRTT